MIIKNDLIADLEMKKSAMYPAGDGEHPCAIEIIIDYIKGFPTTDGWIPCSSGVMPEERDSIFKKFKGTDKWKDTMFMKTSPQVQVTIEFEDGKRMTSISHTLDGKWKHELEPYNSSKVVAWKPLSDPYQEEV